MDFGKYEGAVSEWVYDESIRNDENRPLMFNNIGKVETLMSQQHSHMVTYSDFCRYNSLVCSALPVVYTGRDEEFKQKNSRWKVARKCKGAADSWHSLRR